MTVSIQALQDLLPDQTRPSKPSRFTQDQIQYRNDHGLAPLLSINAHKASAHRCLPQKTNSWSIYWRTYAGWCSEQITASEQRNLVNEICPIKRGRESGIALHQNQISMQVKHRYSSPAKFVWKFYTVKKRKIFRMVIKNQVF